MTTKIDILARVRKLVELAAGSDTNVEEARNAALKAARLIKLHGLQIQEAIVEGTLHGVRDAVEDVLPTTRERRDGARPPPARGGRTAADVVRDAAADAAGRAVSEILRGAIGGGRRR